LIRFDICYLPAGLSVRPVLRVINPPFRLCLCPYIFGLPAFLPLLNSC
jgi:hypothetical protein